MGRRDDIPAAFRASIKIELSGRRTVATADFVKTLAAVNYHWTLSEANQWIEEGERRTFQLFNPNHGGY